MLVTSLEEFRKAVGAYAFGPVSFESEVLELARTSIDQAGMLVVGEAHGVAETPAVVYALAAALGTRALALEWSHDELDALVQDSDLEALWSLPASAEFFAGDGRYTAGHFALIARLREERRLDELILFDRLDPVPHPGDWRVRDRDMAERLLAKWQGAPMLVLTGASHATRESGTLAELVGRARPGLGSIALAYEHLAPPPDGLTRLTLPAGRPAVLPQSREGVKT